MIRKKIIRPDLAANLEFKKTEETPALKTTLTPEKLTYINQPKITHKDSAANSESKRTDKVIKLIG